MPRLDHLPSIREGIVRRALILDFLKTYHEIHGWAPNYREIGAAVGLSSPATVKHQLGLMAREGSIRHDPLLSRAIQVLV